MKTYSPGTWIGPYEIVSNPMIGGMGVVYFALDRDNDNRPVALKTFRPELLPNRTARDRFLREGAAWVELGNHPNIVCCYKVELVDPATFFILELIAKEQTMPDASLRPWLIPGRPMPIEQALLFALQIAYGMQYANEKIPGFVHRDLKPENILVGADRLLDTNINRLRVTDFGLVKLIADSGTAPTNKKELMPNQMQFTRGVGTPLYMAPEQWKGEQVGVFTDIYAFGCILYEMLVGHHAADGKTITELEILHCGGRLRAIPSSFSNDLIKLIEKCLELNFINRFGTWEEIITVLKHIYPIYGQQSLLSLIDSVQSSQAKERNPVGWSQLAIGVAYLGISKIDIAAPYFEVALQAAKKEDDLRLEGAALGNLGNIRLDNGNIPQAIELYNQALKIQNSIGDRRNQGGSLNNLGNAYLNIGELQQAISYHEKALKITREISDLHTEGAVLLNLGIAYKNLGEFQRAIDCLQQALQIFYELNNKRAVAMVLSNLGNAYRRLGDPLKAIHYFEQSLQIDREIGDRQGEGSDLGNMGNAYMQLGETARAIECFDPALKISREVEDVLGVAHNSYNMALLYMAQRDSVRALSLAEEAAAGYDRIGHSQYAQDAKDLVQNLRGANLSLTNPAQDSKRLALEAFQRASSLEEMKLATAQYPVLMSSDFVAAVEIIIKLKAAPQNQSEFQKRLAWLKEVIGRQQSGLFDRLFGKKR